jgi:hypothetical protein
MIVRLIANIAILVGIFLFVRMIHGTVNGSPAVQVVHESQGVVSKKMIAIALGLSVPFHKTKPLSTTDE